MRRAILAVLFTGCIGPIPSKIPTGETLVVSHNDRGVSVREPGWFSVDFPSAPRTIYVPDQTEDGTFTFKKIGVMGDALLTINYVELEPGEAARAEAYVRQRYATHPPSGLHLARVHTVDVNGTPASAVEGVADPDSEVNGMPFPIDVEARFIQENGRIVQLQCSTEHANTGACDRFFASFKLDHKPS